MDRASTIMWAGTVRALPLSEQLKATREAKCDALSIAPYSYTRWLAEGLSTKDMLSMAADNNVRLSHLDPYTRWAARWKPDYLHPRQSPLPFFGFEEGDFFRVAEALKATSMTAIVSCPKTEVSVDQLIEGFAQICDRAADIGVRCDLEFIPFWGLPDLQTAWKIVKASDKANSGIVFDFWHYLRGKSDPDLLESIPGEKISTVQIDDAEATLRPGRTLVEDCIFFRVPPGDGQFPVVDLLQRLHRMGALNRFGPEIFSVEFDTLTASEIARRCRVSLASVFDKAGIPHPFHQAAAA
jgi:sugar phosphate isomerase/epimerase